MGENDLVQMVVELRQIITDVSEFFGEDGANALNRELKLAFDVSSGFYLSRRYRFFNDPTYKSNLIQLLQEGKEVKGDKQKTDKLHEAINNAIPEFLKIARLEVERKLLKAKLREDGLSGNLITEEKRKEIRESKAFQREVDEELGDPDTAAREAMIEYLASFGDARDYANASSGAKQFTMLSSKRKTCLQLSGIFLVNTSLTRTRSAESGLCFKPSRRRPRC